MSRNSNIQENVDLQAFNTLAVPSSVQFFCVANSQTEVQDSILWSKKEGHRLQVLGGGSNVILAESIQGLILKPAIKGREILSQTGSEALIRFGAGEDWHETVTWCLQQGLYGLENLALIPGTLGAAPVQNIGAYGVEVSHFVTEVEYIHRVTGEIKLLRGEECQFAYRESIFKGELKEIAIITHVTLRLATQFMPDSSAYPALAQELAKLDVVNAQVVFDAVCRIRSQKLPDPNEIPNCGSFFKNPVVSDSQFKELKAKYPQIPSYSTGQALSGGDGLGRKLAAAWLIDQAGWKGLSKYGVAVHDKQALVLTNPNRRGSERVLMLAAVIIKSVEERFGVLLVAEPQNVD